MSLSVGLSNFAGSIGIGLSGVDARTRLRVGIAFGLFEGLMPVLGLFIGQAVAGTIGSYGRYLGAGLLVLTGFYTIWQSFRTGKVERDEEKGILDTRQLLIIGAALSLDNLIVGFALGVYNVSIVLAAVVMAIVSVGLSLLGLELGSRLGSRVGEYSEMAGGGVLVLVGIALGVGLI
ncbi:MAG TPA: manganese efflux pump [Candidatus Dormibacteraeota bacterium]